MAPVMDRPLIRCIQDSYGRWWYTPPTQANDPRTPLSAGPFATREDAVYAAALEYPSANVIADGITHRAGKPPDMPRIDRDAERRRAGLRPIDEVAPGSPPAATAPRGVSVSSQPAPMAPKVPMVDEPRGYGQGERFEREHGPDAGRLAESISPSRGLIDDRPAVSDPLARAQEHKQAMRDAIADLHRGK